MIVGVIDAVVVKRGRPVDTMLPQRVAKIGSRGTGTGMSRARAVGGARAPKLRQLPFIVPVRLPPPRWICQALRTANFCPLEMKSGVRISIHGYKEIGQLFGIRRLFVFHLKREYIFFVVAYYNRLQKQLRGAPSVVRPVVAFHRT